MLIVPITTLIKETHVSGKKFVWLSLKTFLIKVVLQEEKTPISVYADEGNQFEIKQLGFEVEQERTALKDALQNLREPVLHESVWVLNRLYHVVVYFGMSKPRWLYLVTSHGQQFHVIGYQLFQHLVWTRFKEQEVDSLLSKQIGIAMDEVQHLQYFQGVLNVLHVLLILSVSLLAIFGQYLELSFNQLLHH
jgi:hypothetical protein